MGTEQRFYKQQNPQEFTAFVKLMKAVLHRCATKSTPFETVCDNQNGNSRPCITIIMLLMPV